MFLTFSLLWICGDSDWTHARKNVTNEPSDPMQAGVKECEPRTRRGGDSGNKTLYWSIRTTITRTDVEEIELDGERSRH